MRKLRLAVAVSALALSVPSGANAALTIVIEQSGADVIATTSGTFDQTGLVMGSTLMTPGLLLPSSGGFATVFATKRMWSGLTGPTSFGSNVVTPSFLNSGDALLVSGYDGQIGLPDGFVAGSSLSATTTFSNATLASLGLNVGTYVYTAPNDTVTLKIGVTTGAVPEPATWAMMIGGFGIAGAAMRRKSAALRFA
jgi:hypothetical protein